MRYKVTSILPALYSHMCTIVQANLLASVMLIALGVKPVCSQHYSFTIVQAKLLVLCSDSPEYENSVLPTIQVVTVVLTKLLGLYRDSGIGA